ncbi:putative integral membrane protein [Nocardia sp. GAS34]|uniref:lipopolysaccharide assembly protein LapA domain-containing protein n=1 Tax=unclassified Nocardia TaxID=2637762 RepID=UPI003D1924FA
MALLVLLGLLVFILQNLTRAQLFYLGGSGSLPIGVAMLLAAVAGALSVALVGTARILQLRHTAHRRPRR